MPYNEPTFGESGEVYTDNVRNSLAHVKSAAEAAQATADNAVASIVTTSQTADEAKEIALAAQGYLETPTDSRVASLVEDAGSGTRGALDAAFEPAGLSVSTESALSATFAKHRRPRMATIGDSIAVLYGDTSTGNRTTGRSALAVANGVLGHRFDVIGPSATDFAFGDGGLKTGDLLTGGHYAAAAAADVDGIFEVAGTNDLGDDTITAATIVANRVAGWDLMTAAGKFVVAATIAPRNSPGDSADRLTRLREVNRLLRAEAADHPGVYLFDWGPILVDPATGLGDAELLLDTVHPNGVGGTRTGVALAAVLDPLIPAGTPTDHLPVDDVSSKYLCDNAFMAGTGGGFAGSQAARGSGSVATSWTIYPGTATSTVVASKVARTDGVAGEWQQVDLTGTDIDNDRWSILQSVSTGWSVGDTIYATVELETDEAGWDARGLWLEITCVGPNTGPKAWQMTSTDRASHTSPLGRPERATLVTPRFVIPSGTTRIDARTYFYGAGTVRLSRLQVVKL